MFTLTQIQSIFDYGMLAYSQAFKKSKKDAIQDAAKAAAAATTVANAEAKMASEVKQVFLTACMEATVLYAHLSGNAHRVAFDRCLAANYKRGLEQLFEVNDIKLNERQSFIYGKGYFLIGLYNEAITTLETAINEDPSCIADAYYYLGKSNACLKNHDTARNYFLRLLQRERDPKLLSDYYDGIGLSYFAQGIYEQAIANYSLALQNNSTNLSAIHNMALAHLTFATQLKDNEQDFESEYLKSQTLLNTIFEIEPNHPQALHTNASLYELTENYDQSIAFYLQARMYCEAVDKETLSAITTNLAECYAQLGHKIYQAGDYLTAEDFYKKALSEDPRHFIAINQLGMCSYKRQDFIGARIHFNRLVHFPIPNNPTQADLEKNLEIRCDAWINRAASLRKTGAFRLSKGSLDIARDLSPADTTLYDETKELSASIIQHSYHFFKQKKQLALQSTDNTQIKQYTFS